MGSRNLKLLPGTGRGTVRRTVEGNARRRGLNDVFNDGALIPKYISGRYAQHDEIVRCQPVIAIDIPLGPIAEAMAFAIDLHHQPNLGTEKVEHKRTSRMLPPELEASWSSPQSAPQQAFRQAERSTQSSRSFNGLPRSGQHRALPSTMLRMVPLPVPGRNYI